MALLNFKFGAQSGLPSTKAPGTIYITKDTKKLFVDNPTEGSTERICLGDFQLVSWTKSESVKTPDTALSNYSLKDANTLYITVESATGATAMWRYSGSEFKAISNSEEIAAIVADISAINTALAGKAPTAHAVNANTYGLGTNGVYGHVKLTDATNTTEANGKAAKGIAASAYAVKLAYDRGSLGVTNAATAQAAAEAAQKAADAAQGTADAAVTAAEKAQGEVDELEIVVGGKADINHASSTTDYGLGSSSNYGHVKLTDAINTTETNGTASKGVAASAYAVKLAYDRGSLGVTNAATAQGAADAAGSAAATAQARADAAYALAETKTTATAVKSQIEAYDYATTTVAQNKADTAQANAKTYTDGQISTVNTTITTLSNTIGNLSNIMNFLGATTTTLSDGSTTSSITVDGQSVTAVKGDVVVSGNKEFVFDGSKWAEIGDVSAQSQAITNLQNTVGSKPSAPTMDNTLWEEVADLRTELGETDDGNAKATAFGRIKALEDWKGTHTTEYTNLNTSVTNNGKAIDDLIAVLTWGSF